MKLYIKILTVILTVLGFASCRNTPPVMYGQPTADFHLNAKVTDEQSNLPVEGIRLVVKEKYETYRQDTLHTNAQGVASVSIRTFPEDQTFTVIIEDVDGEKNGVYPTDSVKVAVKSADYKGGDGSWYHGSQTKDVAIKLKK